MEPFEGKGSDQEIPKQPNSTFRCPHRWSKVSIGCVALAISPEIPKRRGPKGTMLVQNCRRCGLFKASLVSYGNWNGTVRLRHQIKYLKNAEGVHMTDFEPQQQEEN